jgi:hypothetical protein
MDRSENLPPLTEPPGSRGEPRTDEIPVPAAIGTEREQEALRIQAAAVAAQQAAMVEEEGRLQQQVTGLQRQEAQLASHLAARQQQLDESEEQLRQERAAFEQECAGRQAELDRRQADLDQIRATATLDRQKAAAQRQRLAHLQRRLRQRWRRQFDAHESSLKKREQEVLNQQQRLHTERARVVAFQERINGERELASRQLREEWQQLGLAQQQWDETLNMETAERRRQTQGLDARQASVEAAQRELAEREQRWQTHCAALMKEAQGLEARIRNQRDTLEALKREAAKQLASQPGAAAVPLPPFSPPVVTTLEPAPFPPDLQALAGTLDDQRRHLAEQWQRLLEVQDRWQQERDGALRELEGAAQRLSQREGELLASERVVEAAHEESERRRQEMVRMRESLEGWRSRLTTDEAHWRAQREALLAEVESRERMLRLRGEQLEEVHQRRNRRRQQEVVEFQAARARCEEARRQYGQLWQECEQMRAALVQQERSLSSRALALERFRQETIAQAPDSARAETRLDRLARRNASRLEAEIRELTAERRKFQSERIALDEQAVRLGKLEEELLRRQRDYSASVADWENRRVAAEQEDHLREEEVHRLQAQCALSERELRSLRDEIERIVRGLMEEAEGTQREQQAA